MRKLLNEELERLNIKEYKEASKIPVLVVLDNVRSQNNIGSIFRTADAFRLEGLILCGITATPPHREIHKTALGATESVSWKYCEYTIDAIRDLKERDYRILSVEQAAGATILERMKLDPGVQYALVLGHEIRGVDQKVLDLSDQCIEIPQFGTKHSLNIAVAAGIVIWEVFKQLQD
jgi:23S rRNA (guanosine2251-2'-O)-methyltransferase